MIMEILSRPYNKQQDFQKIMLFLADLFNRTGSYENWFPDRFENSSESREDGIRIWELDHESINSEKNKIIALTTRESPKDFYLHVDPFYRHIEQEMVEWIENYRAKNIPSSVKKYEVKINILEGNPEREKLLSKMGYKNQNIYGYYRIRKTGAPLPTFPCPEGFEIRTLKRADYDQLALLIRRVFGHGDYFTSEILEWLASCSFYKKDLDLVVVTPEDIIASFCTFRLDPTSRIISLEPMGTNPDYRGLGLGKAILSEGIKRSMKYDPPFFYIDGAANNPAANRLYDATGFASEFAINSWVKSIKLD